jgi:16S rRNA (guanine966-N2)-methyltransferase
MRIVAGKWRGRPLSAPRGLDTRPTSDRAREALFSMLQSRLGSFEGLKVVDFFAGSGALGLEALSRGAERCVFVERDRSAIESIKANIAAFSASGEVLSTSAEHARIPFEADLALLDPPYGSGAALPVLARLSLAPGGLVSVETAFNEPVEAEGFEVDVIRKYGKARITLLRRV